MRLGEPVARQNFELELYLILAATALLATFWRKIRRLFRRQRRGLDGVAHDERTDSSVDEEGDEASPRRLQQSPTSSRRRSNFGGSSAPSIPAMEHLQAPTTNRFDPDMELEGFVDDINDTSTTAPEWYDGPRDETTLPAIIASIYSDNTEEADFALKQTLSILETMEPKSHFPVFVDALQAIGNLLPPIIKDPDIGVPWSGILDLVREDPSTAGVRLSPNMAQILLDGLPSLFELVTNNEPLNRFRDVLSLFISISICTESYGNVRRQAISAVNLLLEHRLLSQDVLRACIVPGLFDLYEAKSETWMFTANDQRLEAASTLTQLIVWDAVSDRDWIYHNYLPRYSMILNDSIIHARKNAIQIFGELARMFGEKFTEMFLVPHLVALCDDPNWAVRKAVCEVFVSVAEHTSYEVRSNVLARNFVHLIHDPCRWVTFGSFQQLGPLIATFANPTVTGLEIRDGKICLCNGEASSAGPTASIPSVASSPGAKRLHAANLSEQFSPQALIKRYGQLPEGIHVPTSMDETLPPQEVAPISPVAQQQLHQARRGERVMDSVLSGLNKMLNTWEKASPKRSPLSLFSTDRSLSDSPKIQSNAAPFDLPSPNHSIAAKCSSTDDLSKLGLEVGPEKKANDELSDDEDDGADLDVSFFEAEPSATDDETQGSKASSEEENAPKNPLSYWSADCDIDFDDEEELRPFGTSTTSPSAGIYLEDRFDVIRQPRSRSSSFGAMGSPNKISPRRHTNSVGASMKFGLTSPKTSSSSSSLSPPYNLQSLPPLQGRPPTSANSTPKRTRKRSESDMDVDDEAPLDNTLDVLLGSGMDGISTPVQETEENDVEMEDVSEKGRSSSKHVPHELVDCFMSILAPPSDNNYETEVYRYCAHNFPAVAFTLGRDAWPQLKKVYENLAFDDEIRVRSSIAHSIHEIAFIVGSEIADRDLLPVFCTLRSDDSLDVRTGILRHLYDFVKCLSPEKRNEIIQMLPQFFPIGTQRVQHGDWRSRHELISQLTQLCSLYDVKQINNHMSGIALTLANDRVAEVRMEAVMLVSRIVGALIEHEWNTATSNGDFDRSKAPLSVWFVEDIVSSFAETQKWTRRQTFASICAQVIKEKMCNVHQFQVFFLKHLERLINDKVPNVRLAVCEALACWKRCLETANSSDVTAETIQNLKLDVASNLETFANDNDIDVTYLAQRCEGIVKSSEPMNIVVRTKKMHQREEQHFGNRYVFNETGTYAVQRDGATVDVSPTEPPKEPPPSPSLAVAVVSKALPTLPPPHFRPEPPTDIQESVAAAREEATVIPPLTGANPPPTNHPEENVVIDMEIVENPQSDQFENIDADESEA